MPDKRASEIGNAFIKFTKTGDKSLIEGFTREEIESALAQYHLDKGWAHYDAMERRIRELREEEVYLRDRKDILKDRLIGFVLGIIATIAAAYVISLFKFGG